MDRQNQRIGVRHSGQKLAARDRRLLSIPVDPRRPVGLATLDHVVHHVAGHDRALPAGEDIDAAVAGRVPRRRRQRDGIVERVIVIHQKRLPCFHDGQAIVAEYRAGRIGAARVLGFPGRIFSFVKDVFRVRECRHPAAISQSGVPAGMVDMKMRAKDIVDLVVGDAEREQLVAPALLARKIERRRMTLVLAGAGVHQDRVMRRPDHEGLIGYHHHSQRRIEHLRLHRGQVTLEDGLVIGREEVLRPPPRAFAFNHRVDGDVADPDLPHPCFPLQLFGGA